MPQQLALQTKSPLPSTSASSTAWLRELASSWKPAEGLPAEATTTTLAAGIRALEAQLVPMAATEQGAKALAVLVAQTMTIWKLPENWPTVSKFYLEALEDVPADLVEPTLKTLRLSHKFPTLPKPADLRNCIPKAFHDRRGTLALLRVMQRYREREPEATTGRRYSDLNDSEKAEIDRMLEDLKQTLSAAAKPRQSQPRHVALPDDERARILDDLAQRGAA